MIKGLRSNKQKEAIGVVKSSFINGLTAEQINTYIDNNVTNLAEAKAYLKKISKVILYLLKHTNLQ